MSNVELGCGLLALGRKWGTTPGVPSERAARRFLEFAFGEAGVRYFDTAPAYGNSEELLGRFLASLTPNERASVTVATKFGEHWNQETQQAFADHSADALIRSVDRSVELLGAVSVLQLHKPSAEVLQSEALARAIEHAILLQIGLIGVSASDPAIALATIADPDRRFDVLQMPHSPNFEGLPLFASANGLMVVINRPFGMGQTLVDAADKHTAAVAAFRSVLSSDFDGFVLTGTSNPDHLAQNIAAFTEANVQ